MNLTLQNLVKKYGNQTVLKDINLDLSKVKALGIIGESGCGKSTLMRLLAGIEEVDDGLIDINDFSVNDDKVTFQKQIGVVFQKHNLFPHLSLKENIALILKKVKKMKKEEANSKAMALLEKLFIEKEADKKPHMVSGGQAQRCSIARALATDPNLIFLDEPTAALDPLLTKEVLKAISKLKEDGIEFIFVTHEITFLEEFADYILFLKEGSIHEHGTSDCLQNPKTAELRTFLNIEEVKYDNTGNL